MKDLRNLVVYYTIIPDPTEWRRLLKIYLFFLFLSLSYLYQGPIPTPVTYQGILLNPLVREGNIFDPLLTPGTIAVNSVVEPRLTRKG